MRSAALLLLTAVLPVHAQFTTNQAADVVLGQRSFLRSGFGLASDELSAILDVAIDPASGKLFVADFENNRVLRFSSAAAQTSGSAAEGVFGQPNFVSRGTGITRSEMNRPSGITIDSDGNLWVADSDNHRVLRFDDAATADFGSGAGGVFGQAAFGQAISATTQNGMSGPSAVAVGPNGTLWVADAGNNRVLRFDNAADKLNGPDADGVLGQSDFVSGAAGSTASRLNDPRGFAVDAAGVLFVADSGNHRILRFDSAAIKPNGAAANGVIGQTNPNGANSPGLSPTSLTGPKGLALDAAGNLFVADTVNSRVLVFVSAVTTFDGVRASLVLGQPDFDTKEFQTSITSTNSPRGLAFDNAGRLFVSQATARRVTRFSPAIPPAPAPAIDTIPPTIKAKGRRSVDSLRNRVVFRGTTSDAGAIAGVEFRASGQAGFRKAHGTTRWKAVVRPDKKKRKTVVRVRAIDASGNKSGFLKLKIFRR